MITTGRLFHGAEFIDDGEYVIIKGDCVFTGEFYECRVPSEGFNKWRNGELIQYALPEISGGDREFIISGISPAGWDTIK